MGTRGAYHLHVGRPTSSLLVSLSLAACGASAAPPPAAPTAPEVVVAEAAPAAPVERVLLRRRMQAGQRFAKRLVGTIGEVGGDAAWIYEASGSSGVERVEGDRYHLIDHVEVSEATPTGDPGRIPLLLPRLDGLTIEYTLDERNAQHGPARPSPITEETRPLVEEVVRTWDYLIVPYPEEPVAVGQQWTGEVRRWRSENVWAGFDIEPRYTLEEVRTLEGGRREAVIRWEATVIIQPFRVRSLELEGSGDASGTVTIDLADGVTGAMDLEAELRIRMVGSRRQAPFMRFRMGIEQSLQPI